MAKILELIAKFKTDLIIGGVLLLACCLACYGIYHKGRVDERAAQESAIAKLKNEYESKESEWQSQVNQGNQKYEQALDGVGTKLADILIWMRNRPARLPETARTTCKGTTGAELSGPDAEFLARESARADGLKAALDRCQQYTDTVNDYLKSLSSH